MPHRDLFRRSLACLLAPPILVSLLVFDAPSAAAQGSPAIPFRYYRTMGLEKKQSPLLLDTTRIVVRDTSGTGREEARLSTALREFLADRGIAETDIKPCYRDYFWVTLPAGVRGASADTIESYVAALASGHPHCYVSPVLLSENGKAVVVTPRIDFTFSGRANRQTRRALLDALDATVESPFDESDTAAWPTVSSDSGVTPFYLRNPSTDTERYLEYVTHLTHRARNGFQILRLANELAASPAIASASVDCISEATAYSDPVVATEWVPEQLSSTEQNIWPLRKAEPYGLRVTDAWGVTRGTKHVKVAILDTGTLHPDVPATNYDTTQNPPATTPASWTAHHGTFVGSTLVEMFNYRDNVGVAHGTTLTSFKVATGYAGSLNTTDSAWYNALFMAQVEGARVVNMSIAVGTGFAPAEPRTALNMGRGGGIVNFAAIGQTDPGVPGAANPQSFPISESSVLAIGASTKTGERWSRSNHGFGLTFVTPAGGDPFQWLRSTATRPAAAVEPTSPTREPRLPPRLPPGSPP
jgi:hypothetical protein